VDAGGRRRAVVAPLRVGLALLQVGQALVDEPAGQHEIVGGLRGLFAPGGRLQFAQVVGMHRGEFVEQRPDRGIGLGDRPQQQVQRVAEAGHRKFLVRRRGRGVVFALRHATAPRPCVSGKT
jgi:hypothetical protein